MRFSLLFVSQLLAFGLCSEESKEDINVFGQSQNGIDIDKQRTRFPDTDIDSVNMVRIGDMYYVPILAGTPPQYILTLPDTQIQTTIFADLLCINCYSGIKICSKFSNYQSSTFKTIQRVFDRNDRYYSEYGYFGYETVSIGSKTLEKAVLDITTNMTDVPKYFYSGTRYLSTEYLIPNPSLHNVYNTGVLGLGYPLENISNDVFFSRNNSILNFLGEKKFVTIDLREDGGKFSLGLKKNTNETIVWTKPDGNAGFGFKLDSYTFANGILPLTDMTAEVNPRYEEIYMDSDIAYKINTYAIKQYPNCTGFNGKHIAAFTSGNYTLKLFPQYFMELEEGVCKSKIIPIDPRFISPKKIIFGQSFLRGNAMVLGYEEPKIGFIEKTFQDIMPAKLI
ncbi:hypothetical protein BB558_002022 [Smittium angustum]|uniref:Peptidase A1 domain-containing protein n=1 Tax=Smittium angustum TaxID=133377 RepID=A0A2U1JA65_SMIAN|nr:hypothetical protein BB558_002022 [Smittium angustum]